MSELIPFSKPHLQGNEWKYIKECLDTGWVSSAGKYVDLFEKRIAEYTGAKHAVACVNGTAALQVALRLAGVKPGDEVIVPTITFIASVNSVVYNGAVPVFMDVDRFFNLDVEKTRHFLNQNTVVRDNACYNRKSGRKLSAVLPVHVFGHAIEMEPLIRICGELGIPIVEDAAESLGSRYSMGQLVGRHTGTIGRLGCISFNGNKIITTGGGGMILTDEEALAVKAKYLTTQAKNDPVRYIHHDLGYNFRLTNLQAALGVAQLEELTAILQVKRKLHEQYVQGFKAVNGLRMVKSPPYADGNYWMSVLMIDSPRALQDREDLMRFLGKHDIQTRPVWLPNHRQKIHAACEHYQLEMAERLWEQSLCLPNYAGLGPDQVSRVVDAVRNWADQKRLQNPE